LAGIASHAFGASLAIKVGRQQQVICHIGAALARDLVAQDANCCDI